jgi:2-acylglycerol O-acyltransferase 2
MIFEFPHGVFPMGQFISIYFMEKMMSGAIIRGTGADIIFQFPIMRHIMVWVGAVPARRENITKVFNEGDHVAVIPGGIAEMFLGNDKTENVFLRKRQNTVKAAIQEGAHIIPIFFFGNTRIFKIFGQNNQESFLAKISRKLRASVVLFYGRNGLPVPFRHPIKIVSGDIVHVVQKDFPSEEEINEVLNKVIASLEKLYNERKPEWETRPLIIS